MDAISQVQQSRIHSIRARLKTLSPATYNFLSGIVILLLVVFLWTASNFVTQDLYDDGYEKPFFVTYLNTSSFVLYLLPAYVFRQRKWWQNIPFFRPKELREGQYQPLNTDSESNEPTITPAPTPGTGVPKEALPPLTTQQTANLALSFFFLWFIANWCLDASLVYTTAASAMILSSTSGFFTLGVGRLFRIETLTHTKTIAVITSFLGVVLVYLSDSHQEQLVSAVSTSTTISYQRVLGDTLGIVSAIFYAFYVLLLKVRIGSESRIDMQLFFGFVGLFNILLAWPVGLFLHLIGAEVFEWPTTKNLVTALLVNAGITLFSDYLYVIAMLKTTPVVVTVGLSLTIPFTVIGDIMLGHTIRMQVILGALLVMGSFVAVGLNSSSEG